MIAFTNTQQHQFFQDKGYLVLPSFLDASEVAFLQNTYQELVRPNAETPVYSNGHDQPAQVNSEIERRMLELISSRVAAMLTNYRLGGASYLVRHHQPDGHCYIHQDWNNVDETKYQSLNFWIPLTDVSEKNGCLWILPGSHKINSTVRAFNVSSLYVDYTTGVLDGWLMPVKVKAGDAVLYAHNLFHGSMPNLTSHTRITAMIGIYEKEAPSIHYYYQKSGDATYMLKTQPDFYMRLKENMSADNLHEQLPVLQIKNGAPPQLSIEQLLRYKPASVENTEKSGLRSLLSPIVNALGLSK